MSSKQPQMLPNASSKVTEIRSSCSGPIFLLTNIVYFLYIFIFDNQVQFAMGHFQMCYTASTGEQTSVQLGEQQNVYENKHLNHFQKMYRWFLGKL